jgi:hypothetical protein
MNHGDEDTLRNNSISAYNQFWDDATRKAKQKEPESATSSERVTISREDALDAATLFRASCVRSCNADNPASARIFEAAALRIEAALEKAQ